MTIGLALLFWNAFLRFGACQTVDFSGSIGYIIESGGEVAEWLKATVC